MRKNNLNETTRAKLGQGSRRIENNSERSMNGKAKSKLQWHRETGRGRGKEGGVRSAERSAVGEEYLAIF